MESKTSFCSLFSMTGDIIAVANIIIGTKRKQRESERGTQIKVRRVHKD